MSRPNLLKLLREKNVTQVDANYSGYGDSGQVDYLATTPPVDLTRIIETMPHPWVTGETLRLSLDTALREMIWTLAYDNNPGFENNDGGQGEFVWDVVNDKITLDHSYNVVETISEPTVEL